MISTSKESELNHINIFTELYHQQKPIHFPQGDEIKIKIK